MTGTSLAAKPLRQVQTVQELLQNDMARAQLAKVAAKHMNPERMMRVVANAIRTTPKLQECDPMSFLGALMTCASLGLEPNTVLGHAYLVPFKNTKKGIVEVQVIVGYKGFADLARRSGQVTSIHADVVYSDDELLSYEYGSDMHLRHKPGPQEGEKIYAYCHVTLTDGQAFVVLPWSKVMKTRDASQGWKAAVRYGKEKDSPWFTSEDRMGAKTAVRALANAGEMPLSIEFLEATDIDGRTADYSAFAMDPTAGVLIEGETVDPDTGEVTEDDAGGDDKPEPEPDPKGKPKAAKGKAKADKPKATGKDKPDDEHPDGGYPDEIKSLVLRLVDDLRGCDEEGEIDATMDLFGEQIALLKENAPDAYDDVIEAEGQARERVAALEANDQLPTTNDQPSTERKRP